jgi:hypothetical protein
VELSKGLRNFAVARHGVLVMISRIEKGDGSAGRLRGKRRSKRGGKRWRGNGGWENVGQCEEMG